ncbi:metallophosphoesterase [uncultured Sphingomonas sp.]|uniref:metallophosphoesterase n=1 Tax=uncultured Sphingomonas sp. TaxID=158754 RepID=UPI0035CAB36F
MIGEHEEAGAVPDSATPDPPISKETLSGTEGSIIGPDLSEAAEVPRTISMLPVVDVENLDWVAVRRSVDPRAIRSRMRGTVEAFEALLDRADGPGLLFDSDRANAADRAIQVCDLSPEVPVWIIGDLHGDLLALEAALALIDARPAELEHGPSRIIFLGDLFDDEGMGLEVLLRVFELILAAPERVCVVVGNHDEALSYDGNRFSSSVSPSDFADFLNANLAHEWIERAGKLAVRFFAQAPRALFLPDGLLVAHAGFPLSDLHAQLAETGDWNDPACLSDFAWTRAHPTAKRKLPNRFTRGSQFGHEDFAAFCELSKQLGRPVTHMVRGHDHVEERYVAYPAYWKYPVLTTMALSRRLPRESFGPYVRTPTLARHVEGALPQVHRLHIPAEIVTAVFPKPLAEAVAPACGEEVGS